MAAAKSPTFQKVGLDGYKESRYPKQDNGFLLATRNGLEPSTSSVTGWRANRLHHRARTVEIITDNSPFVKRFFDFFAKTAAEFFCGSFTSFQLMRTFKNRLSTNRDTAGGK